MTGNSTANGSSNLEIAQSNQDLIMTKGKRKKRTWIIVGVVCAIAVALIVAAIVFLRSGKNEEEQKPVKAALSLEDVLHGKVNPHSFNATWTSDNELLYTDSSRNLVLRNLLENTTKILLGSKSPLMETATEFLLSSDKQYLLVQYDYKRIYRHSYRAKFTIIELTTGGTIDLKVGDNQDYLQLAVWSPVGNALVFVYDNNIYHKSAANSPNAKQITNGGNYIYNGVPDWVYEEEVFGSNKALWFSPDGKKLAYGRFDDTLTEIMVLQIYGEPGSMLFQYPRANVVKYPKAGSTNPIASLHVVDLDSPDVIKKMEPPSDLQKKQPILSAVTWATNDIVAAIWMNRVQNEASIVTYQTTEPYTTEIVKSLREISGWLELFTPPKFSSDGSQLIMILSQDQGSGLGAYRHLVMLPRKQKAESQGLTKGAYVVTEILSWDEKANLIYYLANTANDSAVQHLYSVSTKTKEIKCITCNIKTGRQKDCLYNSAQFSKDSSFYALNCAGPDVPEISIYTKDHKKIVLWEDNEQLEELVSDKVIPTTKKLSFEIADGFRAQVSLELPPNLDTSGNTKYPMLVNVYGGPDAYQVVDRFGLDWGSYLAANKSIIYATIDGRGSGLKGDKILFAGYRHLGTVEVIDQINVTRLIQENLPYVDASRTGIWGWSYGGYAAAMALATDTQGIFKCGISVAPVTDWALYDSIYTERFMGLPTVEDNLKGYQDAQLYVKSEGLRDKQYFLIHGTYDDNVHYQQSMMWARTLELKDILFRQLSYTDEDHALGLVRPHLYHSLENFLDECFIEREDD